MVSKIRAIEIHSNSRHCIHVKICERIRGLLVQKPTELHILGHIILLNALLHKPRSLIEPLLELSSASTGKVAFSAMEAHYDKLEVNHRTPVVGILEQHHLSVIVVLAGCDTATKQCQEPKHQHY